jgi:putative transposase
MELSYPKKMSELEDENAKLKKLVAEQALDIRVMKAVLSKNW